MAVDDETLIPIGGIAAKLGKVGDSEFRLSERTSDGLLFCFLPLPIPTSFSSSY